MLERLRKLAGASAALREVSLEKRAFAGALVRGYGRALMNNPVGTVATTAGLGLTAVAAPVAAVGSYRKSMAGFDPAVQQQLSGATPVPPGTR